jgi:Xaa-Pro dipeptidase
MANPEFPEFPREEYNERRTRARELMARAGLQALLVTSDIHYRYLTGHCSQMFLNKSRVMVAVFGLRDDPILVIPEAEKGGAEQTAWTRDIRTYAGPAEEGGFFRAWANVVRDAFSSLGISKGRVGIELGSPERLGMAVEDFNKLCAHLKDLEFVDSSELFYKLRLKKSPLEIDFMRKSAEITSRAFDLCPSQIMVGMTEHDVYKVMTTTMMDLGAERPGYIPVRFHDPRAIENDRRAFLGGPTARTLKSGDVIDMDAGCIYKGYWSDFNRTFSVGGEPPKKLAAAYRTINEAMRTVIEKIRPGYPLKEILRLFNIEFAKAKVEDSGIGRMGHGLGLDMPERPSISSLDECRVEPGMTLCIEPNFLLPGYGIILAEEEVIIKDDGCEVISKMAGPELIRV